MSKMTRVPLNPCDKWVVTVKNKDLDFNFGVNLNMSDKRHQEIFSFLMEEANKLLKDNCGFD
jgi:hypothetical protein|tara:strand:- start:53 stop:238 length:186 start_codon:yes stop_codon:yes gene_type:complete